MSKIMSRCVELTAVMDDGSVERATGDELADWWKEAVDHNGECGIEGIEWTDSLPIRKVTEATGWVEDYDRSNSPYISDGTTRTLLIDVVHNECRKDCTIYRFRFVCEAVRVDKTKEGK